MSRKERKAAVTVYLPRKWFDEIEEGAKVSGIRVTEYRANAMLLGSRMLGSLRKELGEKAAEASKLLVSGLIEAMRIAQRDGLSAFAEAMQDYYDVVEEEE